MYDIKRYDVILQTQTEFVETCEHILNAKDSHYNKHKYLVPQETPDCPFIFKHLTKMCSAVENYRNKELRSISEGIHPNFGHFFRMARIAKQPIQVYRNIVILSYAADANKMVEKLIPKLRTARDNERLMVLVLHEKSENGNFNPERYIFNVLSQVDYVIPVITPEYLKAINSCTNGIEDDMLNADNKYVKHIYTLLMAHAVIECRNIKVRGLLPDDCLSLVQTHRLMEHPLLQNWFRNSDIDEVIMKLLDDSL